MFATRDATTGSEKGLPANASTDYDNYEQFRKDPSADTAPAVYYDRGPAYRWLLLAFFSFLTLIAGPLYFNWPPLDDILNWSNAYIHLCDPSDPSFELRPHGEIYCLDKKIAIESVGTLCVSTLFVFNFFGGVLLDALGAKCACLVGGALQILGWILLGVSGTKFNGYRAGGFFLAAGTDPFFFGLISVGNLFPGWASTAIAILGTARSGAFANGIVLRSVMNANREKVTLRGLAFVYAGIIAALLILCGFIVPYQPFPKPPLGATSLDKIPGPDKVKHTEITSRRPKIDLRLFYSQAKKQFLAAKEYGFTWTYLGLIGCGIIQLLRSNYYSATYKKHLPDTTDFYSIMSPLSVIPCPFFGIFADRVSTSYVITTIAGSAAAALLCVLSSSKSAQIISVIFNWICSSFLSSEFYCYFAFNYPLHIYGSLTGFVFLSGGLAGLIAAPMNDYASRNDRYVPFDVLMAVLAGIVAIGGVILHLRVEGPLRRRSKQAKRLKNEQDARTEVIATKENSPSAISTP